jgi:oligoendopeptidase F
MPSLPTWNLADLFKSPADPALQRCLNAAQRLVGDFERSYKGKLQRKAGTSKALQRVLKQYERCFLSAVKPLEYAQLFFCEDLSKTERGAFLQKMKARYLDLQNELLFFELELLTFPDALLRRFIADPVLRSYSNYLLKLLKSKPHRLSEREERLLDQKGLTGRSAFVRLFDEELALKKFSLGGGRKRRELTETEVLDLLYSKNRSQRKAASEALTRGLQEESRRLTYITNTLAEDKAVDDKLRSFPTPEASRHLANEISQEMVDAMTSVVISRYGLVQDFYRFKAKVLGLPRLYEYDRYAPVLAVTRKVPFAQARRHVLDSFSAFSARYGSIARLFFERNWIDATPRKGKRGGAFCSYTTPDLHPYVFLNYTGSIREVFTLAHELGHGVHGYLMRDRGLLNADTPLTIAETASVFAELLLFEHLKRQKLPARELFALIMGKVEGIFSTVFRQISMYRFEQDLHAERRQKGELSTARINELWRARQTEMFGRAVQLTRNYDYWWSYIPHFLHTPFYVYAYAFGELLTLSLYSQYRREGAPFVDKYLNLLSAGGSLSPEDLVRPLNISLQGRSFWDGGIALIAQLVEEAKAAYDRF